MGRAQKIIGSKLWRRTEGTAVVEFAIVAALLFLLVMGILDFGHAWFLRQTIVNASREGARYGVVYRVDGSGGRLAPANFSPTITWVVNDYLDNILPANSWTVVVAGDANTAAGQPLTVTVSTTKNWFAVQNFVNLFGGNWQDSITLTADTTMRIE